MVLPVWMVLALMDERVSEGNGSENKKDCHHVWLYTLWVHVQFWLKVKI